MIHPAFPLNLPPRPRRCARHSLRRSLLPARSFLLLAAAAALLLACGGDDAFPERTDSRVHSSGGSGTELSAAPGTGGAGTSTSGASTTSGSSPSPGIPTSGSPSDSSSPAPPTATTTPSGSSTSALNPSEPESRSSIPSGDLPTRVVVAGDSWSTGLAHPLRDAIAARSLDHVEVSWEFTANAGSQARTWIRNEHPPAQGGGVDTTRPRMLDALHAALDEPSRRTVLFLVLSGNDLNRECHDGWGNRSRTRREAALDGIRDDLQDVVDAALEGRPHVDVVLVGYDYFHFEFLVAFGLRLDGLNTASYNGAFIDLGLRQRGIAEQSPRVHYVHNLGLLQWAYGDVVRPPFSIPNPYTGHPPYDPEVAPKPLGPPDYANWPAGFYTYPASLDAMPDGIHPTPAANRIIADNVLDQVLEELLLLPD